MPSAIFVNHTQLRIESALAAAEHAAALDHSGLTGTVREILVRELLRPLLPPNIEVGTGKIVDHVGNKSKQIDVVLYDRSVLPPVLYAEGHGFGVFPVEACLYAIEVKSKSTNAEVDDAVEKGKSLAELVYLREACGPNGYPRHRVIPGYFAFGSDLVPGERAPHAEIDRWRGKHSAGDLQYVDSGHLQIPSFPFPPIRVLCVVGRAYGFYDGQAYRDFASDGSHREVVAFLTGIVNTLLAAPLRALALPFGYYISDPTQAEAEPRLDTPTDVVSFMRDWAREVGPFDANQASFALFNARGRQRGPEAFLGDIREPLQALGELESEGSIRRIRNDGQDEFEVR